MTWLMFVLYAKKAWIWCRHHWKILAIAAWTLIIWIVARKNVGAYTKVLDTTIENYKKEVEILEDSHNAELQKRNEAIALHNEAISKLEENYEHSLDTLTIEKRARFLELLALQSQDPELINETIEKEFGFKYVE